MGKYTEDAKAIVAAVGGPENITAATNCVTRLRFALVDEGKVDKAALEEIDVVKGSFSAAGQFQVVIGPGTVDEVAQDILEVTGRQVATKEEVKAAAAQKMNPLQQFVKIFSDIFVPLLPALVTAGLLLGINNLLTAANIFGPDPLIVTYPQWADVAEIINLIAGTAFGFLPVLIGWSAVKRFGGNPLLGIVLGCMMVNPALLSAWEYGAAQAAGTIEYWNIFGFQIQQVGYQGQVLPILVASWLLAKLEIWLKKHVAEGFQLLVVAPVALLVVGFATFLVIGPVTFWIGLQLAEGLTWLFGLAPILGGFIYGLCYAPLVITGMHHTFLAVDLQLIASNGETFLWPILALSNIAQGSVAIGLFFVLRSEKQKSLAMTSGISAYLGITEPAMFGVNLRYKFPFLIAIVCAAIGGAFISAFGVVANSIGVGGIPGIFSINPSDGGWLWFGLAMVFEIVVPMLACFIYAKRQFGKEDAAAELAEEDAALAAAVS